MELQCLSDHEAGAGSRVAWVGEGFLRCDVNCDTGYEHIAAAIMRWHILSYLYAATGMASQRLGDPLICH